MNQGKLEVVKQEMARVNTDILGISELKWTRMGEFNSDAHYVFYRGQESLRRNGVALMVNKRVQNAVLGCNLKNYRMISGHFQGKTFDITVIQFYASTTNTKEAWVKQFYEDLQAVLELTPKKRCPFHHGDSNANVGSQEIPGVTGKFGLKVQNEAGQRFTQFFPRECTGYSKHPLPTTQEMTLHVDISRWSIPKSDWSYSLQQKMKKLYTVRKKQDRELTVAQIMIFVLQNSDLNWR